MAPTNLAGLIVNGLDHSLAPNAIIRTRPSVDSIGGLGEGNAPAGMSIDDEQAVLGVEARRTIIRHPGLVGCNKPSVGCRFLVRIRNRTALLIDSKRPVHGPERSGQKVIPVRAVKHKEVA